MRRLIMFENRHQPVASNSVFLARLSRNALWAMGFVAISVIIGTAGYMYFESMALIDAFANAAMILSGMGPLAPLFTTGGKIFAALYAIASGFLLIGLASLMLAPLFHRILHRFHVDEHDCDEPEPKDPKKAARRP